LKSKKTVRDSAEFFVREFEKPASIIRGSQSQQQETINKRTSYGNLVLSAMGGDVSQPEKKIKVLFVGDSQTAGSNSYANKLLKSGRVDGKILAKTGANTYVLATTLKKELDSGEKYDVISIMAGGNDAWRDTPAVPMQNLAYMYRISKESGARVVAISNPSKKNVDDPSKYPSNDLIAKFVETGEHKADSRIYVNGNLSYKSNFEPDMIHLNNGAHNTIALKWERDILA
jgi:lysophospholipase L1-like esterase